MTTETQQPFAEWCIVELLGHRRLAGHLQEVQLAGAGFLRLDIPEADGDPARTQYIAPGSVYALHPVTEATARAAARQWRPEPVSRWELTAVAGFPNPSYETADAIACTEDDMSYQGDIEEDYVPLDHPDRQDAGRPFVACLAPDPWQAGHHCRAPLGHDGDCDPVPAEQLPDSTAAEGDDTHDTHDAEAAVKDAPITLGAPIIPARMWPNLLSGDIS